MPNPPPLPALPPDRPAAPRSRPSYPLVFWTLLSLLVLLALCPLWLTDILPLPGLARTMHLASVLRDLELGAAPWQPFVAVHMPVPGGAVPHLIAHLSALFGLEDATIGVLTAALLLFPLASLALIRAAGHDRWLVFALVPWILGASLFDGDLAHLVGLPVFLGLLVAHLALLRRSRAVTALGIAVALVALALTDPVLWIVALASLPLLALLVGGRLGWRSGAAWSLREVSLGLPSVVVLLPWARGVWGGVAAGLGPEAGGLARLRSVYSARHLTPLASLDQVFGRMFDRFAPDSGHVTGLIDFLSRRPGELVSALWLLGLSLWLYAAFGRAPARPGAVGGGAGRPAVDGGAYVRAALVLVGLAYVMLPQSVVRPVGFPVVSPRLVEPLVVLSVAALPLSPLGAPRRLRWAAALGLAALLVASVMMSLQTAGSFMLARTGYGALRSAYGVIPPGRRVLTLRSARRGPWLKAPVFDDLGAWGAIIGHQQVAPDFSSLGPAVVRLRPGQTPPAPDPKDDSTFSARTHGRYQDYVVIHRGPGERPGKWDRALSKWPLVFDRGMWRVYRNPTPERWPPLSPRQRERVARLERLSVLALDWIGLSRQGGRRMEPDQWLKMLGVSVPWPPTSPAGDEPVPAPRRPRPRPAAPAPDPASTPDPGSASALDSAPSPPLDAAALPLSDRPPADARLPPPVDSPRQAPPASPLGGRLPAIAPDALVPLPGLRPGRSGRR